MTKTGTISGATITSTIVYKVGYSRAEAPIELRVVSMKLKLVQNNAFYMTREDLGAMTVAQQFVAPNNIGTKYWQKIYDDPHPGCWTNANGYCTFTKQENLPILSFPYSTTAVGIYGGFFGAGNISCLVNVVHRFVPNTLELVPYC